MADVNAGQVKKAYLKALRDGLRNRGFEGGSDGQFRRAFDDGSDNFIVRLRAAGSGETVVDVLTLGVGVTVDRAEQGAAELRGTPVNPNRVTLVADLFAISDGVGAERQSSRDRLNATKIEDVDARANAILELVDDHAESWWQAHHDLDAILDEMRQSQAYREIDPLETMGVLALALGRRDVCQQILDAHRADLERRGADHPAFEPNLRWRADFEEQLRSKPG